jgi:hypothetical protein
VVAAVLGPSLVPVLVPFVVVGWVFSTIYGVLEGLVVFFAGSGDTGTRSVGTVRPASCTHTDTDTHTMMRWDRHTTVSDRVIDPAF